MRIVINQAVSLIDEPQSHQIHGLIRLDDLVSSRSRGSSRRVLFNRPKTRSILNLRRSVDCRVVGPRESYYLTKVGAN
jgi:hypothetical protein